MQFFDETKILEQSNQFQVCALGNVYCSAFCKLVNKVAPDYTISEPTMCIPFYMNKAQQQLAMSVEIQLPIGFEFVELDLERDSQVNKQRQLVLRLIRPPP
jgi:hypothetical protein